MIYVKQITGTHFPSFKSRLAVNGSYGGQPLFQAGMKQKWVWFDVVSGGYVISDVVGAIGDYAWSQDTPTTNPDGAYHVTGSHCEGAPVVGSITTEGPHGIICMWSGSIAAIPAGWVICDGTHGTPDLRDKFIIGAGTTYAPGASGGSNSHSHSISDAIGDADVIAGTDIRPGTGYANVVHFDIEIPDTNYVDHLPTFYALAYIMHI